MKKAHTTYYEMTKSGRMVNLAVNEETKDHISLYEGIEPCSGVLQHWGSRKELIAELEDYISILKQYEKES